MPLIKEQLMIPRVLCIGGKEGEPNYPGSMVKTGEILTHCTGITNGRYYESKDGHLIHLPLNFPNCFKPLPWWYGRTVDEMPLYLKFIDDGKTEFVLKVEKYLFHKDTTEYWAFEYLWENEPDVKRMALSGWKPADLTDYMEYQKQNDP